MKFLPKFKQLNNRGIAHFILPLAIVVAVGTAGTYMVVAGHAASVRRHGITTGVSHASHSHSVPINGGVLVLFSEGGRYNRDEIRVSGAPAKDYKCGGSFSADGVKVVTGFKAYKPTDSKTWAKGVSCSPVGDSAFYNVKFGYKNDNGSTTVNNPGVNVDVDAHTCTLVHPDGTWTKVPNGDNNCNGNLGQKPALLTPSISVRGLKLSGKKITGYVDVAGTPDGEPGSTIRKDQKYICSGSVAIVAANGKKTVNSSRPLKYTKNAAYHGGNGYCVATVSTSLGGTTKDWAGKWTVTATLTANPGSYFADGSAQGTLSIATASTDQGTGGTASPN